MTTEATELYDLMAKTLREIDALAPFDPEVDEILAAYHAKEAEIKKRYKNAPPYRHPISGSD
jgi:hypothetical protein